MLSAQRGGASRSPGHHQQRLLDGKVRRHSEAVAGRDGQQSIYNLAAGPDAPVEQVSWKDVQSFLGKANAMQSAWTVRLPTEAEWEYAARAGSTEETYGPLDEIAWYKANGDRTTHPVGQKKP